MRTHKQKHTKEHLELITVHGIIGAFFLLDHNGERIIEDVLAECETMKYRTVMHSMANVELT